MISRRQKNRSLFKSHGQLENELVAARRRLAELEAEVARSRGVEAALRGSEAEVRAIVDALPDLVIRVHRDGTFLDVKSPSQDILSLPAEEIVGRNIRETGLPREVMTIHLWNMEAALRTRTVQAFEYPLRVPRGERDFEGRAIACSDDEVLFVIRDITDSKRASERYRRLEARLHQAKRMESVGRLAAGVAHNLNNLLAPILGYAELLSRSSAAETRQDHLKGLLEAADGARELTQQLLAVGDEQEHEVRRIDLRRVVTDYQRILRSAIRKEIALEIRQADGPVLVEADLFKIQQVLLNLVLNACDAISGAGQVMIETRGIALEGEYPRHPRRYGALRVSDTGSGVEPDIREQIFEPFFTTKKPGQGTGLGLSSVFGIVRQHGGEVRLESVVGEGSTFEVLLPLCEGAVETAAAVPASVDIPDRKVTVLVVEDDEMVNRLVSRILRDHGYLVLTAASGEECLHLVQRHPGPIDLLLTDLVMARINGRQLYRRLGPLLPGLKVLYMTGHTDDSLADYGIQRDSVHLVRKPFTISRLLHEVKDALGHGGRMTPDSRR